MFFEIPPNFRDIKWGVHFSKVVAPDWGPLLVGQMRHIIIDMLSSQFKMENVV